MNTQAEVERIRAEYQRRRELEAEYSRISAKYPHGDRALYEREEAIENELARGFSDMDVKALLAVIERQQAVIEAAARVAHDVTAANWYEDAFTYLVDAEALETLRDKLAGMKG